MGQSLSRRPSPDSAQERENNIQSTRRSLPRRILSSIPKPSVRSRPALVATSSTLPASSEQTLRGKKRLWRLSRRHDIPSSTVGDAPRNMDPLAEHDEHQDDRDVDEFGVITNRVPDSHDDSSTSSPKGKEKAREILDDGDEELDRSAAIPSSSTSPPFTPSQQDDQDEVVIAPTDPPSLPQQLSPLPRIQQSEPSFPPPTPTPPQPQSLSPQANTTPRPFPPPGTLVVVQGVVHTTDVQRPPERSAPAFNPTLHTSLNDAPDQTTNRVPGSEAGSTRPSSVPPSSRSRNSLSGIPPRPSSMIPAVPSSPSDSSAEPSSGDPPQRQSTSNTDSAVGENEDEDRPQPYPHGISMAQGPVGASGLSASSIDVLGTLLSVAAAATAASLLTGSSEPIFSSGLTSSQPQPPSNPVPPPSSFSPNAPSERPLSPTPTSDAGRMRHVWSSLRDRLGLGSGTNASNASNDTTSSSRPGLGTSPQASDVVRPRDPREIMLAEMARAFNLGLGLGGPAGHASSAPSNSDTPEVSSPENGDASTSDRITDQSSLPPPDSFERFLMDLQNDLRVTLMQSHEPGVSEGEHAPQTADPTAEDVIEDSQPLPELQSLSDSDSEEYEPRLYDSDHDDELDPEDDLDDEDDDVHTVHEELDGRTSPAVSALGTGIHSPFGIRSIPGSPSTAPVVPVAPSQSILTALSSVSDSEAETDAAAGDSNKTRDGDAEHATSSFSRGIGSNVPSDCLSTSETPSEEGAVLGVGYSPEASNGAQGMEVEGGSAVLGDFAVPPHGAQDPSNVPESEPARNPLLLETSSSGPSTSHIPTVSTGVSASTAEAPPSTISPSPSSDSEPAARNATAADATTGGSSMPLRLPFTASSASRTEHTPGGGINWWRMYRFPAIASPITGQGQVSQPSSQSQSPSRTPVQGPSLPSIRTPDQAQSNQVPEPRAEPQLPGLLGGLSAPSLGPSAPTNMPGMVSASNQSTSSATSESSGPSTNPNPNAPEHRGVVVPVIVVGLQSVNMDRQGPQTPHPLTHEHQHVPSTDNEDGQDVDFDNFDQPMSMPMNVPEPPGFPHYPSPSHTFQQEQQQESQQPPRGRTWQSRAANAFRNLRPSRRNADATSPQPQETPGSRTFLIYVIGGYYPPDHQIITGGNLDSFEALWELAELLGQVKPPTVSKEEIEKSGLEIIKSSMLEEYEKSGRVASNCVDRCLICLDDYSPDDNLRVLTCKHTFHQGCVDRWLETGRNNCPACRSKGVGTDNVASPSATSSGPAVL